MPASLSFRAQRSGVEKSGPVLHVAMGTDQSQGRGSPDQADDSIRTAMTRYIRGQISPLRPSASGRNDKGRRVGLRSE